MKMIAYSSRGTMTMTGSDQIAYSPHRFSVDEYFRMVDVGILDEDDRVELIEGVVVVKEPPGPEHSSRVSKLAHALTLALDRRAIVRTENPTLLDTYNAPEPDVAVVEWRETFYSEGHPRSANILLAIEVAWSSAYGDRRRKAPLYARVCIPEYWLLDIPNKCLEAYSDPSDTGYATVRQLGIDDEVSPLAFQDVRIRVRDVLIL